jgi:hypothetical protein
MDHAVDLISESGVPGAVEMLVKSWEGEGKKTFLDDRSGVTVLKVSGFEENIRLEYTIRQDSKKISVRVTAPDYSVSEESGTYYKEPQPVPPSKNYLGLELEELLRDPGGRLLIKDVAKGTISATEENIAKEIIQNAISAAVRDPRFPPVTSSELKDLVYSVDILGETEDIDSPEELDVKKYGVIVSSGYKKGLLLPNLEGIDSVDEQIWIAMQKAGIRKGERIRLQRFEVVRYH